MGLDSDGICGNAVFLFDRHNLNFVTSTLFLVWNYSQSPNDFSGLYRIIYKDWELRLKL